MCLVNQLADFGVFDFFVQLGIALDFEHLSHKRAYVRCEYRFSQFDDILVFRVLMSGYVACACILSLIIRKILITIKNKSGL
jgi:hypothetical protein